MGILRSLFRGQPQQAGRMRRLEGDLVDIEIVGESGYQDYLRTLRRRRELEIVLRPDPTNAHDRNAVVVLIDDQPVGYLPRAAAKEWQPLLAAAEAEGFYVAGPAEILGGTKDKPNMGVFGSVPWPGRDAPPDRWATGRPAGPAGRPWPRV